jgi:hypothetical protein
MLKRSIAVLALATTLSVGCLAQSVTQPRQSQTAASSKVDTLQVDIRAVMDGLNDDFDVLRNMASSLQGHEQDNAVDLVDIIHRAVLETDAAFWFITPYNKIGCDQDREIMRGILQNRLKMYSHLLDLNIDTLSQQLTSTRLPAVSQVALRAQDKMRSAKRDMQSVLDAIQ